jgi:uncharacterized protein (DUF4415 family)
MEHCPKTAMDEFESKIDLAARITQPQARLKKDMRTQYDFTKAKRNPYAKRLKKTVTIRLDPNIIDYFKSMSGETDIPYQNLINLYLLDCAKAGRKLSLAWKK